MNQLHIPYVDLYNMMMDYEKKMYLNPLKFVFRYSKGCKETSWLIGIIVKHLE